MSVMASLFGVYLVWDSMIVLLEYICYQSAVNFVMKNATPVYSCLCKGLQRNIEAGILMNDTRKLLGCSCAKQKQNKTWGRYTVPLKSKLPPSRKTHLVSLETRLEREKQDESCLKRDVSRFSRVHWKNQYFAFKPVLCIIVYIDLRGRHDFHSHQRCVCTMCVL